MAERRVARGELDVNTSFQSNRFIRLKERMPDMVRAKNALATSYLSFNTREIKAFRDSRVRRALSESIDREFITGKLMRAGQLPAYAFVPPGTANYARAPEPSGPTSRWPSARPKPSDCWPPPATARTASSPSTSRSPTALTPSCWPAPSRPTGPPSVWMRRSSRTRARSPSPLIATATSGSAP
uniref:Solute-binding protein family 5 domain-containing protein n=1 Tax=Phenylobacterium glaciei TaxID=2803784 RepID=A0A974S8P1_9CAUL|nr:hypothetical protein JKL49_14990 [Phenylobacterium glaciei]